MPDPTPTIPTDEAARGIADVNSGFVAQNAVVGRQTIPQEYPEQDGAIGDRTPPRQGKRQHRPQVSRRPGLLGDLIP